VYRCKKYRYRNQKYRSEIIGIEFKSIDDKSIGIEIKSIDAKSIGIDIKSICAKSIDTFALAP
jgi:hypothetical protein